MITIIKNEKDIKKLYKHFINWLQPHFNTRVNIWVSTRGGSFKGEALYSTELNIWFSHGENLSNRYWIAFGIGELQENKHYTITTEINFPKNNIDRKVAGAFATDDENNILVLHRGKIGGGKKGIGKKLFERNFYGQIITAIDGDKENKFALVGYLKANSFFKQIAWFVKEIKRIKDLATPLKQTTTSIQQNNNFSFNEEYFGTVEGARTEMYSIERTHGVIVNKLAEELKSRNISYANDQNRDLFIYNHQQITTIFEIKTDISNQNLYSGIGQLILYSVPLNGKVRLKLVIPNKVNEMLMKKLSAIGIDIIYYDWIENEPKFQELDKHL